MFCVVIFVLNVYYGHKLYAYVVFYFVVHSACYRTKGRCTLPIFVLTIFNEGAYLTFKSIFHRTLNLF